MRIGTFLLIIAFLPGSARVWSQTSTRQPAAATPASVARGSAEPVPANAPQSTEPPTPDSESLPKTPDYPVAEMVTAPPSGVPVELQSDQQEKHGSVFTLTGAVRIEYKDYVLTADKISYDQETSDAEADGHVRLQGRKNDELILADHGKLNFDLETGRFENVTGSIGRVPAASNRKQVYTTSNPFLFTGRPPCLRFR